MQQKELSRKKSNMSPLLSSASNPKATQFVWNCCFGMNEQQQNINRPAFQMNCMDNLNNPSLLCFQHFEMKPEEIGESKQNDAISVKRISPFSSCFGYEQKQINLAYEELKKEDEPFHRESNMQVDFTSAVGQSVVNDKNLSEEIAGSLPALTSDLQTAYKLSSRKLQPQVSPSNSPARKQKYPLTDRSPSRVERRTKRRKAQEKRIMYVPFSTAMVGGRSNAGGLPSDVWAWRKYGQKPIKGSPYPRGYYRCSSSKGCLARKQVERSRSDPSMLIITYTSDHNHPAAAEPPQRINSLRSTSNATTARREELSPSDQEKISVSCQPTENPFFSVISSHEDCLDGSVLTATEVSTDSDHDLQSFSIFGSAEDEDFYAELDELPESSTGFKKVSMDDKLDEANAGGSVVDQYGRSSQSCWLVHSAMIRNMIT